MSATQRLRDVADGPEEIAHQLRRDIREVLAELDEATSAHRKVELAAAQALRGLAAERKLLADFAERVRATMQANAAASVTAARAQSSKPKRIVHDNYADTFTDAAKLLATWLKEQRSARSGQPDEREARLRWCAERGYDIHAMTADQARAMLEELGLVPNVAALEPTPGVLVPVALDDAGWCFASDVDAENWTGADSRDDAIARGKLDFEGAPFVIAPGRRIAARDLAVPNGESFWEDVTGDDFEVGEQGMERLTDTATDEEIDDLGKRIEAVVESWLEPIAARCGWWMVDAERAEEIEP